MNKIPILALLALFIGAVSTRADFTDYYAFPRNNRGTSFSYTVNRSGSFTFPANNWSIVSNVSGWVPTGGPGSPAVTATDSQLFLDSGSPIGTGVLTDDLRALITAPTTGFWSFDFQLTLSAPNIAAGRAGYYAVNGVSFTLREGSGTVSDVFLHAGDTFGFGVFSQRNGQGVLANARLTVTNFSAPVPEPHSYALIAIGAGVFAACCRFRKRI